MTGELWAVIGTAAAALVSVIGVLWKQLLVEREKLIKEMQERRADHEKSGAAIANLTAGLAQVTSRLTAMLDERSGRD